MKKSLFTVLAIMTFTLIAGAGNSSLAPAKQKLTENLYAATVTVSDCL